MWRRREPECRWTTDRFSARAGRTCATATIAELFGCHTDIFGSTRTGRNERIGRFDLGGSYVVFCNGDCPSPGVRYDGGGRTSV